MHMMVNMVIMEMVIMLAMALLFRGMEMMKKKLVMGQYMIIDVGCIYDKMTNKYQVGGDIDRSLITSPLTRPSHRGFIQVLVLTQQPLSQMLQLEHCPGVHIWYL